MSRATSPSFSVGGVAWLDHTGLPGDLAIVPPVGWRCFHCNEQFWGVRAAMRHFGYPREKRKPICVLEERAREIVSARASQDSES